MQETASKAGVRLDKWLWAARFFKTRSLAAEEIARGRVLVNGQLAKASREVRPGDTLGLRQGVVARTVVVLGVSAVRGPAPSPRLSTRRRRKAWPPARRPPGIAD
jgi:ribosome-associated heat shock protein Hsp15